MSPLLTYDVLHSIWRRNPAGASFMNIYHDLINIFNISAYDS